jgi:hypothetical protein
MCEITEGNMSVNYQTPPALPVKKQSKTRKVFAIISIVLGGLLSLCILSVILINNSPSGKANLTQIARGITATALRITKISPLTQTLTKTPFPTKTLVPAKPTKTVIPTKTLMPTETIKPSITVTPTKVTSQLSYLEIINKRDSLTEIQWDDYKKQINGLKVHWSGTVYDVEKSFGMCDIEVCMNQYSCLAYFTYPCEASISLNKNHPITFEGEIDTDLMDFLGFSVYLANVIIISR